LFRGTYETSEAFASSETKMIVKYRYSIKYVNQAKKLIFGASVPILQD
jgi:hypothetical protein